MTSLQQADAAPGSQTLMARETLEAAEIAARILDDNRSNFARLGERLRSEPPPLIVTCARGSSDHAATYGKYLIEALAGVPVASAAPSIASVYEAPLATTGAVMIAVSQSGRSPDLLATTSSYRQAGALIVALVNDTGSPLAETADITIPLLAGPERSVAATKSCIASLVSLAAIVAAWRHDEEFGQALADLPAAIDEALRLDWSAAIEPLSKSERMFVLGRGFSLGIAQEAGLKLKETCAIQAEPFSAAEVRHGPMRIIQPGFPVLGFATSDAAGADVAATAAEFAALGAISLVAGAGGSLPTRAGHPALEPIAMLASFYRMAEELARARGMDPDTPPLLKKVTQTL